MPTKARRVAVALFFPGSPTFRVFPVVVGLALGVSFTVGHVPSSCVLSPGGEVLPEAPCASRASLSEAAGICGQAAVLALTLTCGQTGEAGLKGQGLRGLLVPPTWEPQLCGPAWALSSPRVRAHSDTLCGRSASTAPPEPRSLSQACFPSCPLSLAHAGPATETLLIGQRGKNEGGRSWGAIKPDFCLVYQGCQTEHPRPGGWTTVVSSHSSGAWTSRLGCQGSASQRESPGCVSSCRGTHPIVQTPTPCTSLGLTTSYLQMQPH